MNGGRVDTVVVVPVLRRPHRAGPLAESHARGGGPGRLMFVASEGDDEQISACRETGADLLVVPRWTRGDYARKINRAAAESPEAFVFTGADDLDFHPGWLIAALRPMQDPAIGVVGTNDLGNSRVIAGDHATHFLVRQTYRVERGTIDERGKIFHESYPHEFVDDELVATAQKRGAWAHAGDSIVEHLHPHWGKAPTDELYAAIPKRMAAGRRIFARRRRLWK